eukprot:1045113-Alexandrium_andersonii.AAC.1
MARRAGGARSRITPLQGYLVAREAGVPRLIAAGSAGGFFFRRVATQAGASSPTCDPPICWVERRHDEAIDVYYARALAESQ